MADKENQDIELSSSSGGSKKIIVLIIIGLILIAGSIGTTIMIMGGDDSESADNDSKSDNEKSTHSELKPSLYLELKPDFVINFESGSRVKFLSVQLQVMAREQSPLDVLQTHMPVIRNDILLLLSAQKYDEVSTREGKKKLQSDILELLKNVILHESQSDDEKNAIPNIEAVYFTSFIMQ